MRDSRRAQSANDDRLVEAVVGERGGSTGYAESLRQRVPRLLTEDRVHQLDHLVLGGGDMKRHASPHSDDYKLLHHSAAELSIPF